MPALVCSAQNCVYNNAMYCSREDIRVGGANASACQDTCCESFQERKTESMKSSMGTPSTATRIDCEAKELQIQPGVPLPGGPCGHLRSGRLPLRRNGMRDLPGIEEKNR